MTIARRLPFVLVAFAAAQCRRAPPPEPDAAPPPDASAIVDAGAPDVREAAARRAALADEAALAIAGTHAFVATGSIKDPDAPLVEAEMARAYERMRSEEEEGKLTRVDLGGDLFAVDGGLANGWAAIFLHGWGGRFALPCWQVARAVRVLTACPDAGVEAAWWSEEATAIVKRALEAVRRTGREHVVLVGLSNGASGAMRLPSRLPGAFAGLVLVSGANPQIAPAGVPTLVVHGRRDGMAPAEGARAYAKRSGAKLVMLDRGHFAMLLEADAFEHALAAFFDDLAR